MVKLSRRDLVAGAGPALLAQGGARLSVGCQTNAWRFDPNDFAAFTGVLKSIARLGYSGFETGFRNIMGRFPDHVDEARRAIAATKLVFTGCHIFLTEYDPVTGVAPQKLGYGVADAAAKLGAQRLILSGRASVNRQQMWAKAKALGEYGRYCRTRGLGLSYHNHWPEFENGGMEIGELLQESDPALVSFVVDAGHASRAKADVAGFFAMHRARIAGIHFRDFRGGAQVPLGEGETDYGPLAAAIRQHGWKGWALAEEEREDGSKPGESAAGPARGHFRKLLGV